MLSQNSIKSEDSFGECEYPNAVDNDMPLLGLFDEASATWQISSDNLSPTTLQQSPPCGSNSAYNEVSNSFHSPLRQVSTNSQHMMLSELADRSPMSGTNSSVTTLCAHVSFDNRRCTNLVVLGKNRTNVQEMKNNNNNNEFLNHSSVHMNYISPEAVLSKDVSLNDYNRRMITAQYNKQPVFSSLAIPTSTNDNTPALISQTFIDVPDSIPKQVKSTFVTSTVHNSSNIVTTQVQPSSTALRKLNTDLNISFYSLPSNKQPSENAAVGKIQVSLPENCEQSTGIHSNLNNIAKDQSKTIILDEKSLKTFLEIIGSKSKNLSKEQMNLLQTIDTTVNNPKKTCSPVPVKSDKIPLFTTLVNKPSHSNNESNKESYNHVKHKIKNDFNTNRNKFQQNFKSASMKKKFKILDMIPLKFPKLVKEEPSMCPSLKELIKIHNEEAILKHDLFPENPYFLENEINSCYDFELSNKSCLKNLKLTKKDRPVPYFKLKPIKNDENTNENFTLRGRDKPIKECLKLLNYNLCVNEEHEKMESELNSENLRKNITSLICSEFNGIGKTCLKELKRQRKITQLLIEAYKLDQKSTKKFLLRTEKLNFNNNDKKICLEKDPPKTCKLKDGNGQNSCLKKPLPYANYCKDHIWYSTSQKLYILDKNMQVQADVNKEIIPVIKKVRKRTKLLPLTKRYKKKRRKVKKNKDFPESCDKPDNVNVPVETNGITMDQEYTVKGNKTEEMEMLTPQFKAASTTMTEQSEKSNDLTTVSEPRVSPPAPTNMSSANASDTSLNLSGHEMIISGVLDKFSDDFKDFDLFEERPDDIGLLPTKEETEELERALLMAVSSSDNLTSHDKVDNWVDEFSSTAVDENVLNMKPDTPVADNHCDTTVNEILLASQTTSCEILSEDSGIQMDLSTNSKNSSSTNKEPFQNIIDTVETSDSSLQPPPLSSTQHYTFGSCLCGLSDLSTSGICVQNNDCNHAFKKDAQQKDKHEDDNLFLSEELQEIECVLESLHSETATYSGSPLLPGSPASVYSVDEKQYTNMLAQQLSQEAENQTFNRSRHMSLPSSPITTNPQSSLTNVIATPPHQVVYGQQTNFATFNGNFPIQNTTSTSSAITTVNNKMPFLSPTSNFTTVASNSNGNITSPSLTLSSASNATWNSVTNTSLHTTLANPFQPATSMLPKTQDVQITLPSTINHSTMQLNSYGQTVRVNGLSTRSAANGLISMDNILPSLNLKPLNRNNLQRNNSVPNNITSSTMNVNASLPNNSHQNTVILPTLSSINSSPVQLTTTTATLSSPKFSYSNVQPTLVTGTNGSNTTPTFAIAKPINHNGIRSQPSTTQNVLLQPAGSSIVPVPVGIVATASQGGNVIKILVPPNTIINGGTSSTQQNMILIPVNSVGKPPINKAGNVNNSFHGSKHLTIAPSTAVKAQLSNLQTGQQFFIVNSNSPILQKQESKSPPRLNLVPKNFSNAQHALILNPVPNRNGLIQMHSNNAYAGINKTPAKKATGKGNLRQGAKSNSRKNASSAIKQKLQKQIMRNGKHNTSNKPSIGVNNIIPSAISISNPFTISRTAGQKPTLTTASGTTADLNKISTVKTNVTYTTQYNSSVGSNSSCCNTTLNKSMPATIPINKGIVHYSTLNTSKSSKSSTKVTGKITQQFQVGKSTSNQVPTQAASSSFPTSFVSSSYCSMSSGTLTSPNRTCFSTKTVQGNSINMHPPMLNPSNSSSFTTTGVISSLSPMRSVSTLSPSFRVNNQNGICSANTVNANVSIVMTPMMQTLSNPIKIKDNSEPVCKTMNRKSKGGSHHQTLSDDEVISEDKGGGDIGDEHNASGGVVHWNQTTTPGPEVIPDSLPMYITNSNQWSHMSLKNGATGTVFHSSNRGLSPSFHLGRKVILGNLGSIGCFNTSPNLSTEKSGTKLNVKPKLNSNNTLRLSGTYQTAEPANTNSSVVCSNATVNSFNNVPVNQSAEKIGNTEKPMQIMSNSELLSENANVKKTRRKSRAKSTDEKSKSKSLTNGDKKTLINGTNSVKKSRKRGKKASYDLSLTDILKSSKDLTDLNNGTTNTNTPGFIKIGMDSFKSSPISVKTNQLKVTKSAKLQKNKVSNDNVTGNTGPSNL